MINLNNSLSSAVRASMTAEGSSTLDNIEYSKTGRDNAPSGGLQQMLPSNAIDTVQEKTHDDIADIKSEIEKLTKELNGREKAPEAEPAKKEDIRKGVSINIKSVISAVSGFVTGYAVARIEENMEKVDCGESPGQDAALQKSTGDNSPDLREKEKAMSLLIAIEEGDSADTSKDLAVILKSLRPDESIRKATEDFIKIMKSKDCSTYSSIPVYNMIDSSLNPGENRSNAVDSYLKIFAAEDDSTVDANNAYQMIDSLIKPGERRMDAAESYLRILRETDSTYETCNNYRFIDSYIDSRNPRKTVTDDFLRVLNQTDSNSRHSRDIFAQLHTIH